jgi:transcriptional regulator with GAF, ATPase, and Fis domain
MRNSVPVPSSFDGWSVDNSTLLGTSAAMAQLRNEIETAAASEAKVLISGETGVGKEVVARAVHRESMRRQRPFVTVNCAALPDGLIESELFGHVRGSFTDAYQDRVGLAVVADGSTLFLDEIGEMSPRMQAVLLRFAETREVHPIGADRVARRVDVRLIAATNRNLAERIASGDFRQDLYYRLHVVHISIPPLRARGEDVLLLFRHFLAEYAQAHRLETPALTPECERLLLAYQWPGNVRELKNVTERIIVRHPHREISPDLLPPEIRAPQTTVTSSNGGVRVSPDALRHPAAEAAWTEMVVHGKSFWATVHPLFIDRELTKNDVRYIIKRGLEQTQGSYRKLTELFHVSADDYKRFLAFLYQHDCHLAFRPFRETSTVEREARGRRRSA